MAASQDSGFFADLGRAAAQSENYGGNTREQGYTNMVDLGHLARQTAWMLPSAQAVSDALADCVLYQVGGVYRAEATGLSCYYSYSGDLDDFNGYIGVGAGLAFKHLFAYELTGELAEGGEEYLDSLDIQELPERLTLADTDWDGAPLDLNDQGTSILTLGPEADRILAGIGLSLYYVDEVTVTADTAFGEAALFDGRYAMVFEMLDAAGNYAYSDAVTFDCANGEITTTVYMD